MSEAVGTPSNPLRVAIVGSGPSGFYAAEHLERQDGLTVEIDMFDRLPTPFGLVRGGVAPDHPKIKTVTKVYDKIAADPRFHFFGNAEIGKDLSHDELKQHYHAIIYAVGAQSDRRMGIPGEDLPGSHAATEFVAWYNAHPDYRHLTFDLSQKAAVVIGNGNVAMDVARILASGYDELAATDIADYALEVLRYSQVRDIYVLGRRGPIQAAFTNPELKEFGELPEADVIVHPNELELDQASREQLMSGQDKNAERNMQTLMRYSIHHEGTGKPRRLHMRFLVSPVELIGTDRVEAIKLVKNYLCRAEDGSLKACPTDEFVTIPAGLVFRSIGYKGVALPGVPFDERHGIIPNTMGRIVDLKTREIFPGEYVVGWIKRGPSGIIGTNKPDSQETVDRLLEDLRAGRLPSSVSAGRESIERLLADRGVRYVTYADWQVLDEAEQERGKALGRPRVKYGSVDEMLHVIAERKGVPHLAGD